MSTDEISKLWEEIRTILGSVIISKDKLAKMNKLLNQIINHMGKSSKLGTLSNTGDAYEQLHILARLGSTLENLYREIEELERLDKKIQAMEKRVEMDLLIMDKIREQLRKKLQIVVQERKSDLKF